MATVEMAAAIDSNAAPAPLSATLPDPETYARRSAAFPPIYLVSPVSLVLLTYVVVLSLDLLFACSYQLEALEMAMRGNTIAFLETGSGKTLIAIMLLRAHAHLLRREPSSYTSGRYPIAVFLTPTVILVSQQANVIQMHTDLSVGRFWGDMGVDFWTADTWERKLREFQVFVMTPQILLDNLRHGFFNMGMIKLLVFDECHHAKGRHPYACIMTEFYHRQLGIQSAILPRIFGMTASIVNTKGSSSQIGYEKQIVELESLMASKFSRLTTLVALYTTTTMEYGDPDVYTVANESILAEYIAFSTPKVKLYKHQDIPYDLFVRIADRLELLKREVL
ncbi:hypothetical protein Taro_024007 [Colocasia esculenta]|uniref:Helicase ATP-binding domain-containing protein n=1 Tax=Colocasia esculenta TaxID=4460 RepID=A0A843V5A5_COLES|nr:hypothetical protein [Colocasia esculenta]